MAMKLTNFQKLFGHSKMAVIGMIHTKPLPGTPRSSHTMKELTEMALEEANIYKSAPVDAVLVENMADLPYIKSSEFGPEIVASMTRICSEVRSVLPSHIPCGIQVLAGGNLEALAVSKASGLQFIRCEGFVFSHVADEGWMDSCAGKLLRYRRIINSDEVLIFADIKKKHSAHTVTSDISVGEMSKAAEFFAADGVILTGSATGEETNPHELNDVKTVTDLPVLIGSGVTIENVDKFTKANGLIVGSHFKKFGKWDGELDAYRIKAFMEKVKNLRME